MPSHKYPFERGGPPRVILSWSGIWKNMKVEFDGREVGGLSGTAELKEGREFPLGDGSRLHVQLHQTFGNTELRVTRDGVPLPGSGSDPVVQATLAWGLLWFIAGLNLLLGLVAVLGQVEVLLNLGLGWSSVVVAAIYGALGWVVKARHSSVALGIGIALFALDGLATLAMSVGAGGSPGAGGIVMRVFFIMGMARAFPALAELRAQAKAQTAPGDPKNPYSPLPR